MYKRYKKNRTFIEKQMTTVVYSSLKFTSVDWNFPIDEEGISSRFERMQQVVSGANNSGAHTRFIILKTDLSPSF